MTYPLIELGGNATLPTIALFVANGFVPQTYQPMVRHLSNDYHIIALPPRALWDDHPEPPPVTPDSDWQQLADDAIAAIEEHQLAPVIAVGHSFGGITILLAALKRPDLFSHLICLDPTILTPQICAMMDDARQQGMSHMHPLAQGAMRRRDTFDSVEEAYQLYKEKRVFSQWDDEALRQYAQYGTRPKANSDQRILTWSGAWEAYYYQTGYSNTWAMLPRLQQIDVPMLFINGSESDTYISESVEEVKDILPDATHQTIEGYGHLFPQEAPRKTAGVIQNWLSG